MRLGRFKVQTSNKIKLGAQLLLTLYWRGEYKLNSPTFTWLCIGLRAVPAWRTDSPPAWLTFWTRSSTIITKIHSRIKDDWWTGVTHSSTKTGVFIWVETLAIFLYHLHLSNTSYYDSIFDVNCIIYLRVFAIIQNVDLLSHNYHFTHGYALNNICKNLPLIQTLRITLWKLSFTRGEVIQN